MKKIIALILSIVLIIGICPQLIVSADLPENIGTDYVAGEVTGNVFDKFYYPYHLPYNNDGTGTTITYDRVTGRTADGSLVTGAPGQHTSFGIGVNVNDDTSFWQPGNTLIFSVKAKKNSGSPKLKFSIMQTNHNTVETREYPGVTEGAPVTSDEYQQYNFTMVVPDEIDTNFKVLTRSYLGFPVTPEGETPDNSSMTIDNNVYFGVEYAHDIVVSADSTAIVPGGNTISVDSQIVNQVGAEGALSQSVTWYALNEKRTAVANGISIDEGADGTIAVSAASSVPTGKYTIVAVSDAYTHLVKGIDIVVSDIITDYVPGEMPVNLYTGTTAGQFNSSRNYNHNGLLLEGEKEVAMDVTESVDYQGNLILAASRDLPDPNAVYVKDEETGYHVLDDGSMSYIWPLSGISVNTKTLAYTAADGNYSYDTGNLVFSFDVYNSSSYTEPVYGGKLNIARQYIYHTSQAEEIEFPIEYSTKKDGFEVSARTNDKRQKFSGTFKDTGKYKLNQYRYTLGMSQGTPKGANITIDNIYFGIEQPYDIEVKTEDISSVAPGIGGEINVSAKILNQVGTTGGLEQGTFDWYVVNSDKTDYVSGITVKAGDCGTAVVTVDKSVPAGTYTVVAASEKYEDFVANTTISVGYDDYVMGEMPENLINEELTAAEIMSANNNKLIKLSEETGESADVVATRKANGNVVLTAKRDLTSPYEVYEDADGDGYGDTLDSGEENTEWALSGAGLDASVLNLPDTSGALVYSFKVSNNNASCDVKVNFGRNTSPLYPVEFNDASSGMDVLASGGKWQVFCGTIPDGGNINSYSYSIGLPEGTKKGASVTINADDVYLGIESPYDIENNIIGSDSVPVGQGGTISLDADILNQVYRKGSLTQGEFSWCVLDENKINQVSGITVTAGSDGTATVNVDSSVPIGTYNVIASSKLYSGFVKSAEIHVVLPEDAAAEGMAQHVAENFDNGWDESAATLSGCTVSCNESGVGASSGSVAVNVTENGGMLTFPIRTEASNKYKVSAWIRADGDADTEGGYFVFTNAAQDGGSDVINEIPVKHTKQFAQGEWVYVTAEYSADGRGMRNGTKTGALLSGTVGFRFGSDSAVSYSIDEFFVIPFVDNKINHEDVFHMGSFDTEECLEHWEVRPNEGHDIPDKWKVTNGYTPDGYRNKPGALELDAIRTFDAIRPGGTLNIEYGAKYKISFDAKSVDDIAVGQPIWFYMSFGDFTGDGYDAVFNKNYHVHNGRNPSLTKDWQHFEIEFDYDFVARNLAEAILGLRTSDLQNVFLTEGGRPHYMLDNASLVQIGGEDFVVNAGIFGDVATDEGAEIKFNYIESTKGNFLYRIVREAPDGDYCIATDFIDSEVINFSYTEDLGDDTLRLDLIGTDAYGNYSQIFTMPVGVAKKSDKVSLNIDDFFWNEDTDILNATLIYENNTDIKNMNVYAALYSSDGKLIALNNGEFSPVVGAKNETTISVSTTNDDGEKYPAAKAKFFVWYDGSNKPVTYSDEVYKSVGEYIFVDAQSVNTEENGTKEAPFKSVTAAVEYLESLVATTEEENIYVVLESGEYVLSETLDLSAAATFGKNITFTTKDGEKAAISGAMHITGFTEYENGIYRVSVPAGTESRQFYVNGIKATRARSVEDVPGFENLDLADERTFTNEGLSCTDTSYAKYKYPTELELIFFENFCQYRIRPDSITEADGKSYFTFTESGNASAWERLELNRTLAATTPVYLENALELLDEPGEWYLDTHENYLYYMPRSFEDVATADFVLPVVEQLVRAEGTPDSPVKNLSFRNIDFKYSTWNFPTENRHFSPNQVMYYQNKDLNSWDGGNEIIPGAVEFKNVHNLTVDNCDFAHIGSNGLVLIGVVQNCDVTGNEFYEISCNGINLGEVETSSVTFDPSEEKYFVTDNEIANNYIHKIGDDYYSAGGIVVGYPKNTVVRNNEIVDCPYMGIHVGWGWASYPTGGTENLLIADNYIHNMMNWRLHDGAPIYLVGKTSGTGDNINEVRGNYIADTKNLHAGIYPDNGTTNWTISQNVIDTTKYPLMHTVKETMIEYADWLNAWSPSIQNLHVRDNYSTTTHGRHEFTGGTFEEATYSPNADWDETAQSIVDNAGIERKYHDRFDFDIQMLTLPNMLTISCGTTQRLYYDARTTKDELCDLSDCEITVKSSNENIVTATKDSVTAVGAGKAFLTYAVCRKDASGKVTYYDEHRFIVAVE